MTDSDQYASGPVRSAARGQIPDGRLRTSAAQAGGCLAVGVAGEIDYQTAPLLRARVLDAMPPSDPRIVLDLDEVTFCDSSGIAILVGLRRAALTRGGDLMLACVSEHCLRIIAGYGLNRYLTVRSTVGQAAAELDTAASRHR
jgi:anti-sigma B factor antagonist